MLLRNRVGGRVYGFATVQCDGDEGDIDGRRYSNEWPYLDFAFYSRL